MSKLERILDRKGPPDDDDDDDDIYESEEERIADISYTWDDYYPEGQDE